MNTVFIREYRFTDRNFLVQCMREMQEHVASIDPLKRSRRVHDFNPEKWVDHIMAKIECHTGVIFVAEVEGKDVGCIAGIIKQATEEDLLDMLPFKDGRIIELYVDPSYRKQNVGSLLVERMERHFREAGCKAMQLGCFASNANAHKFYKKRGYMNVNIEMSKILRPESFYSS